MSGIDIALVIAAVLLVAIAVTAGLQIAQDRAEAHLIAVRKEIQEWHRAQPDTATHRFCATCGADLYPPIPPAV